MKYLLDTNTCVVHLRSRGGSDVSRALAATPVLELALCSVVKAELLYGAERSRERERNRAQIGTFFDGLKSLPFDDAAAEVYATIRSK